MDQFSDFFFVKLYFLKRPKLNEKEAGEKQTDRYALIQIDRHTYDCLYSPAK